MSIRAYPGYLVGAKFPILIELPQDVLLSASDAVPLSETWGASWWARGSIEDGLDVAGATEATALWRLVEALIGAEGLQAGILAHVAAADDQAVADVLHYAFPVAVSDGVALAEVASARRLAILAVVEALAIAAPSAVTLDLLARSLETLATTDSLRSLVTALAPDGFEAVETATAHTLARALAQELVGLATAPRLSLFAAVRSADAFASEDAVRWTAQALALEGLSLADLSEPQARSLLLAAELLGLMAGPGLGVETTGGAADAVALVEALRFVARAWVADTAGLADGAQAAAVWKGLLTEILALHASAPLSVEALGALADNLAAQDALRFIAQALVADGLSLAELTDAQAANVLRAVEWLALATAGGAAVDLLARAPDALGMGAALTFLAQGLVQDLAGLADTATAPVTVTGRLQDLAGLRAQPAVQATLLGALVDRVATAETLRFVAQALIEDGLSLATLTQGQTALLVVMAEALGIGAAPAVRADLLARLVDQLVAGEVLGYACGLSAADTAGLADALSAAVASFLAAPETLALVDEVRSALVVVGRGADLWAGGDQLGASLAVALRAPETLAFVGLLPLAEGDFQAWVVNTDTLGATSYANFPFNSLYTHAGTTWGVTETGLYELAGDDDDGEPIAALLRTGMLDFGGPSIKAVPRCYLYVHSDGRLTLKTIEDSGGRRSEHWYAVHARDGDARRVRPVRLGRGLRFVSVAFELVNVDGSSLDLRGVEVLPVVLRRV